MKRECPVRSTFWTITARHRAEHSWNGAPVLNLLSHWRKGTCGHAPSVYDGGLSGHIDQVSTDNSRSSVDSSRSSVDNSRLSVDISLLPGTSACCPWTSARWPWTSARWPWTSIRCEWTSNRAYRLELEVLETRFPRLAPTCFTSRQPAKARARVPCSACSAARAAPEIIRDTSWAGLHPFPLVRRTVYSANRTCTPEGTP